MPFEDTRDEMMEAVFSVARGPEFPVLQLSERFADWLTGLGMITLLPNGTCMMLGCQLLFRSDEELPSDWELLSN